MLSLISTFARGKRGTAMADYGLIAVGICLAIAVVVAQIDGELNTNLEMLALAVQP